MNINKNMKMNMNTDTNMDTDTDTGDGHGDRNLLRHAVKSEPCENAETGFMLLS
jgi:hypothetical protein